MPKTYKIPEIRRKILVKPEATTPSEKPHPVLDMENYENILKIVENMSLVFERSPSTFKNMQEEDIRNHFLVQLNGHFEGEATGETFNHKGKTDILIRHEGKNIFISECKFWNGKSTLLETIDQILKYTSWRDTKTAIFLFNKNRDTTNVLRQIPDVVKSHSNFKKELDYGKESGFRYIFKHDNDAEKDLFLTVLVFDIPN
jgi:hypothetical protein